MTLFGRYSCVTKIDFEDLVQRKFLENFTRAVLPLRILIKNYASLGEFLCNIFLSQTRRSPMGVLGGFLATVWAVISRNCRLSAEIPALLFLCRPGVSTFSHSYRFFWALFWAYDKAIVLVSFGGILFFDLGIAVFFLSKLKVSK